MFAFAISQLSQHLLTHLSWRGPAETLVMLLAVFGVWFTTSWSATLVRADQSRTRWLMLTVMLLGLFMDAAETRAFVIPDGPLSFRCWSFNWGAPSGLSQIQPTRSYESTTSGRFSGYRNDTFMDSRRCRSCGTPFAWWALAAGIDQVGRWLAHPIPGRRSAFGACRLRRRSYAGTLPPVPDNRSWRNGPYHRRCNREAAHEQGDAGHGHVSLAGNGRPMGAEFWAVPQTYPSARGKDE